MSGDESKKESFKSEIPDVVGPERTLLQMFTLYVDPEVERRKYPCVIVKAQVLFFEGRSPEVRLNDEVKISLVMKAPVADCTTFGSRSKLIFRSSRLTVARSRPAIPDRRRGDWQRTCQARRRPA